MKVSLHVHKAGTNATIQDLGRCGVAERGFTTGGAMDHYALHAANVLVDNKAGAAVIELTLGGFQMEVDGPVDIAVCGAEAPVQINQRYVESWRTHALEAGDILSVGYAQRGARLYIAIGGGIQVPSVLGSASTVIREGLGGFQGRSLQDGDAILLSPRSQSMQARRVSVSHRYRFGGVVTLAATVGPQWQCLTRDQKRQLLNTIYTVSPQCDRMGYRLVSDIPLAPLAGMLSEGVGVGTVQLPSNGQPIVLMRDHQTMGGYPKPLVLLPSAVDALAQCRQGDRIKFELHTGGGASHRCQVYQQRLQKLPWEYVS
ncbi:MAG TPA: biotin-dependent carboxyltransferase family protein [Pseudomonadales bacterium]|nr:biotin-dependent carboxyltransferase family protein [Pseudomonadales bacterium]